LAQNIGDLDEATVSELLSKIRSTG
jgi:hypothetical protein